jgi:hypothetical protein
MARGRWKYLEAPWVWHWVYDRQRRTWHWDGPPAFVTSVQSIVWAWIIWQHTHRRRINNGPLRHPWRRKRWSSRSSPPSSPPV